MLQNTKGTKKPSHSSKTPAKFLRGKKAAYISIALESGKKF